MVYALDYWLRIHLIVFIETCLFGATSTVKIRDESKYIYSGYGIAFDGACSCSFGNAFAENIVIYTDFRKNNFSVLCKGPNNDVNDSVGSAGKMFSIDFNKTKKKFCLSLN